MERTFLIPSEKAFNRVSTVSAFRENKKNKSCNKVSNRASFLLQKGIKFLLVSKLGAGFF